MNFYVADTYSRRFLDFLTSGHTLMKERLMKKAGSRAICYAALKQTT